MLGSVLNSDNFPRNFINVDVLALQASFYTEIIIFLTIASGFK